MATKVQVSTSSGATVDVEISGGGEVSLGSNAERQFSIGRSGSVVQFLTAKVGASGQVKLVAVDGNVLVSVNGGKDRKVSKGKSLKLSPSSRAVVREAV